MQARHQNQEQRSQIWLAEEQLLQCPANGEDDTANMQSCCVCMSGKVIQAVQTLTIELRMQTRSLAEWEPTGMIILQTCKADVFACRAK